MLLRPTANPEERLHLGELDADGRVSGFVPAGGEASLEIWIPGYGTLQHPTTRISLPPGVQSERKLEFEVGSLLLELPGGIALPATGMLELQLAEQSYRVDFDGGPSTLKCAKVLDNGRRFQLNLSPSEHTTSKSAWSMMRRR